MDKETQTMADRQYAFVCQMTGTGNHSSPAIVSGPHVDHQTPTKWNPAIDEKAPIEATVSRTRPVQFNAVDGRIQPVSTNFRINPPPRNFQSNSNWPGLSDKEQNSPIYQQKIATTTTKITTTTAWPRESSPYNIVLK
jgi:hypothetical protein